MKKEQSSWISIRAFASALIVLAVLMVGAFVLTKILPCEGITVGRWLLSPFLVLGAEGSATIIAVIVFLLVIGGIFSAFEAAGLSPYLLKVLSNRFGKTRYRLMAVLILFFMGMGSMIGSFEECVPLVPIVTSLAVALGWDAMTGLAMSILAAGCGFAAGIFNPFSVGIAQEMAGLPMFSGFWFRAVAFVLIYGLLFLFVRAHAKKIEKEPEKLSSDFVREPAKEKALKFFGIILGSGILIVLFSPLLPFLRDYTMIIVAFAFLVAGITSVIVSGMDGKEHIKTFVSGVVGILPAVLMILMASSIKFTLEEAGALNVLLEAVLGWISGMPKALVLLFIYLIVLVLNFFIASGSAKAVMVMPLILPIAAACGISPQLCVMAYAFGDGFSNCIYPTNPVILISLGVSDISYGKWFKWTGKFQLANLLLTAGLLLLGLAIGYH